MIKSVAITMILLFLHDIQLLLCAQHFPWKDWSVVSIFFHLRFVQWLRWRPFVDFFFKDTQGKEIKFKSWLLKTSMKRLCFCCAIVKVVVEAPCSSWPYIYSQDTSIRIYHTSILPNELCAVSREKSKDTCKKYAPLHTEHLQ